MSWLANYFYPQKPISDCKVELRFATEEELKSKKPGWFWTGARVINSFSAPYLMTFRDLFNRILYQSPELAFAPLSNINAYATKNPEVMKAVLLHHRSDSENGIFSHNRVTEVIMDVMTQIFPAVKANDLILTCDPEHTKIYRDFLNKFFSSKSLKKHIPTIEDIIEGFTNTWQIKGKINLNTEIKLLATSVMAKIFLDHPGPYEKISIASSNIIQWLTHNAFSTHSMLYRVITSWLPQWARITTEAKAQTVKVLTEAVAKAIETASSPKAKNSLIKEMIDENKFTDEQMQAMVITLFLAGQDNVSTSLTHILLKLAQNPNLQRQIREERSSPLESPLIRAVLSESLRTLCPVGGINRCVGTPSVLTIKESNSNQIISETLIGKGEEIHSMLTLTAKDSSLYPQPENFDVNRHNEQSSFLPGLPFLPFGHGRHLCPGWYMYYCISAILVSKLAKECEFSTTFIGEPIQKAGFVTSLGSEISISITPLTRISSLD